MDLSLLLQSNLGYPNSFVLRILDCVRISEFVQITEVVVKINRKDLSRSLSPSHYCEVVLTTLLCLIEAIAPATKTRNNKILQTLV